MCVAFKSNTEKSKAEHAGAPTTVILLTPTGTLHCLTVSNPSYTHLYVPKNCKIMNSCSNNPLAKYTSSYP